MSRPVWVDSRVGAHALRKKACQPEVQHLDVAVLTHHHVFGFDVAVHDARGMRDAQRPRNLATGVGKRREERTVAEHLAKGPACHELQDDEVPFIGDADVVDRDDVGMVERGGGPGLLFEPPHLFLVVFPGEQLERGPPPEPGVLDQVDDTHPAGAQSRKDLVVRDAVSNRHRSIRRLRQRWLQPRPARARR